MRLLTEHQKAGLRALARELRDQVRAEGRATRNLERVTREKACDDCGQLFLYTPTYLDHPHVDDLIRCDACAFRMWKWLGEHEPELSPKVRAWRAFCVV